MTDQSTKPEPDQVNPPNHATDEAREHQGLPEYESLGLPAATYSFPAIINAYWNWNHLRSFHLCGESSKVKLFTVEAHSGYDGKTALGDRAGFLLRNGQTTKDPIIAAVGNVGVTQNSIALRRERLNLDSLINLPPLRAGDRSLVTEHMHGRLSDSQVEFLFSIEIDLDGKHQRAQFVWRKFKKNNEAKEGGFRLVWLPSTSQTASSSHGDSSDNQASEEVVAILTWDKWIMGPHYFTLQFLDTGHSGVFGSRWSLMVAITAVRLLHLKVKRRTTKATISKGEKEEQRKKQQEELQNSLWYTFNN